MYAWGIFADLRWHLQQREESPPMLADAEVNSNLILRGRIPIIQVKNRTLVLGSRSRVTDMPWSALRKRKFRTPCFGNTDGFEPVLNLCEAGVRGLLRRLA